MPLMKFNFMTMILRSKMPKSINTSTLC